MSKWLIAIWLNSDGKPETAEMRGAFVDDESRDEAQEELELDDAMVVPIELEGDDEATLEIGELFNND